MISGKNWECRICKFENWQFFCWETEVLLEGNVLSSTGPCCVLTHIGLLERRGAPGGISCLEKDFPTSPWSFMLCSLIQWGYKLGDLLEFFIKRLNGSYSQVNFLEHRYTYELLLENESKEILWNSVKEKQEIRQHLKEFNVVDYFCLHKFKV